MAAGTLTSQDKNWLGGNDAYTTTQGNDFWLTFMNNNMFDPDNEINQDLIFETKVAISAEEAMSVIISYDGTQIPVSLSAGETKIQEIPRSDASKVYLYQSETSGYKGVHVYSAPGYKDKLFSCFLYCRTGEAGGSSRDASIVIPTRHLGKEYIIQTSPEDFYSSEFAIVATEPGTVVNIYPTFDTYTGKPKNTWMTPVSLNAGDAYLIATKQHVGTEDFNEDLSGSIICSNKPIAVFNGNQQTSNPVEESSTQDFSVEQALPINQWGTDFYLSLMDYTNANDFIITAAYPASTSVTMISYSASGGVSSEVINTFNDHNSSAPIRIEPDMNQVILHSNLPIMCYAYTTSAVDNTQYVGTGSQKMQVRMGDPANAMLPSWSHRVKSMNFFSHELDPQVLSGKTPPQLFNAYIVVPAADIDSENSGNSKISMDGSVIPTSEFHLFEADNTMAYTFHPFDHAVSSYHHIESTGEGFVGTVYALSHAQGYFHTLGFRPPMEYDSLFITNTEVLMSVNSYDLPRLDGHGWYQRQWNEWIEGKERLDTAVVCDSSFVYWAIESPASRPIAQIDWNLYDVTDGGRTKVNDAPFPRQDTPAETDVKHEISYQFILPEEPMEDRHPFFEYELEAIIHRTPLICTDNEDDLDTLRTVTRVTRIFNDTVWVALCMGDSLKFFKDSLYNQDDLSQYRAGKKEETKFKATKAGEGSSADWEYNIGLGHHEFQRTYVSQFGCDSIMTLEVFVCDTFRFVDTIHLCSNQDTLYHGATYYGNEYKGNKAGKIRVRKDTTVQYRNFTTEFCECQLGDMKNQYKDKDGHRFNGCDSIYELHLFIHPSYDLHDTDTMRYEIQTDSVYHWHIERNGQVIDSLITKDSPGVKWNEAKQAWIGDFADTLYTKTCAECNEGLHGCDSINSLTLIFPQVYHFYDTVVWCRLHYNWDTHTTYQRDYMWEGHHDDIVYTTGGDYIDSNPSRYGADSIYYLHLVYSQAEFPLYDKIEETVCLDTVNRTRNWTSSDGIINTDTIRQDSVGLFYHVDESRCDTIYEYKLRVLPTYFIVEEAAITEEQVYEWQRGDTTIYGGEKATAPYDTLVHAGYTRDTLYFQTKPVDGTRCDSIHVLILRVGEVFRDTTTAYACGQDTEFLWFGKDQNGDDSLRMRITNLPAPESTRIYTDPHTTSLGYDSIYYLKLYRAPSYFKETTITVCQDTNNLFTWAEHYGRTLYTRTGQAIAANEIPLDKDGDFYYTDSIKTFGYECDSIWELHLHIDPIYDKDTLVKVCQFEDYQWLSGTPDSILDVTGKKVTVMPTDHIGDYKYDLMFHTDAGCHSVWHLTLHVDTIYTTPVSATNRYMCDKDTLHFFDRIVYGDKSPLKPAGVAGISVPDDVKFVEVDSFYTTLSSLKCDSAVQHHFIVYKSYADTVYERSCQPSEGKDSLFQWDNHKTVWDVHNKRYISADSIPTNVKGDTTYMYIDSLHTTTCSVCEQIKDGCDSLFVLYLRIDSTYHFYDTAHVCENERYTLWQNVSFAGDSVADINANDSVRKPGVYHERMYHASEVTGCDSIYYLELYVHPVYDTIIRYTFCDNDQSYEAHHFTFTDTHGTSITEQVDFAPHGQVPERDTADTYYPVRHESITHTLKTVDGCDSVVRVSITILPTYEFVAKGKGCFADTIYWRGGKYFNSGIYYDRYTTDDGCDSIFILEFLVKPVVTIPIYDTICDNETYVHTDTLWYTNGSHTTFDELVWKPGMTIPQTYTEVLFRSPHDGCDSIRYRYYLTINKTYSYEATTTMCTGEPFEYSFGEISHTWQTTIFEYDTDVFIQPHDSTFVDSLTTVLGCDSVFTLHASILPTYRHVDYDTICGNDMLQWRDTLLHDLDFGSYVLRDSFHTVDLCDSIYELRLEVRPRYYMPDSMMMCANMSHTWHDQVLEDLDLGEHIFYDSLKTIYGCDSVYELKVVVMDTTFEVRPDTICTSDTLFVTETGHYYMTSGHYVDTTLNEAGCMHFIYTNLEVIPPTVPTLWAYEPMCQSETAMEIHYTYTNRDPISYTLTFDSLALAMGFEDLIDVPITEYSDPMVITIPVPYRDDDHTKYPRPDIYSMHLILNNGICRHPENNCTHDSDFVMSYPVWITEQRYGDIIALLNDTYNGGYRWSDYQWYQGDSMLVGETKPYLYIPTGLIVGEEYHVMLTREGETTSYPSCPITIVRDPNGSEFAPVMGYLSVSPTCIVAANPTTNILSRKNGTYRITNSNGRLVSDGTFQADVTPIQLPAINGLYIIQLWSPDTPEEPYRAIKVLVRDKCDDCATSF